MQSGVLWHLLLFIFKYDYTLAESGVETSAETNQQVSELFRLQRQMCVTQIRSGADLNFEETVFRLGKCDLLGAILHTKRILFKDMSVRKISQSTSKQIVWIAKEDVPRRDDLGIELKLDIKQSSFVATFKRMSYIHQFHSVLNSLRTLRTLGYRMSYKNKILFRILKILCCITYFTLLCHGMVIFHAL